MVRSPRDASPNLRAALRSHETVPPRDRAVRTGDSESGHFLIPLGNRKRRGVDSSCRCCVFPPWQALPSAVSVSAVFHPSSKLPGGCR